MNDGQEGAVKSEDVQRALADLQAIDKKLAEHLAARAPGQTEGAAQIQEGQSLIRAAIGALSIATAASAAAAEAGEETGTAKRRVKIKAESEVAPQGEPSVAEAPATKAPGRGSRSGTRAGKRTAEPEKEAPTRSLLARLGAATIEPNTPAETPRMDMPAAPTGSKTDSDTAERLAQLEAEIAGLTEAVTASHAATPAEAPALDSTGDLRAIESKAPAEAAAEPQSEAAAWHTEPDAGSDDDEDAEITIIGADGAPVEPVATARVAPRIFREGPPPFDEEAEVEIRGAGMAPAGGHGAPRSEAIRVRARTSAGNSARTSAGGALSRWRLFRGSN